MGIRTTAEYVENDRILAKLREMGVDYAQGFGIHVPEPLVIQEQRVAEKPISADDNELLGPVISAFRRPV
jgi:EAL domain-containing protein (putative c-di-GMP-specific phosphodiesterase class I)